MKYFSSPGVSKPITPCNVTAVDVDCLVIPMVSHTFEEHSACQERNLQSFDVDINAKLVPGVQSYGIGDKGTKEAIEVEKEEQGPIFISEVRTRKKSYSQYAIYNVLNQIYPVKRSESNMSCHVSPLPKHTSQRHLARHSRVSIRVFHFEPSHGLCDVLMIV